MTYGTIDVDSPDWLGCGVADHEPECLCDVRCDGPEVPIRVKNLVTDMKYGMEICEIRGYTDDWTPNQILDYLEDLVKAHDAMRTSDIPTPSFGETKVEPVSDKRGTNRWKHIRNTVRVALRTSPRPTISTVLGAIGITAEEFMSAVTTNKVVWDANKLDRFESVILLQQTGIASLGRQFGVSPEVIKNLIGYWDVSTPKLSGHGARPYSVRMKKLILAGHDNKEIIAILKDEYDVTLTSGAISKARTRTGGNK